MPNLSRMEFDPVHDTQIIYRNLLRAMSSPGVVCEFKDIVHVMDVPSGTSKAAAAIAYTLLDGESSFASRMREQEGWAEHIRRMTYSKLVDLVDSDYVFASGEEPSESLLEMESLFKIGSLSSPEQSATIFIKVKSLRLEQENREAEFSLKLSGPGIETYRICHVEGLSQTWLDIRARLVLEYPLGVDVVLFTESGELLCLPRTTIVEGGAGTWPTLQ